MRMKLKSCHAFEIKKEKEKEKQKEEKMGLPASTADAKLFFLTRVEGLHFVKAKDADKHRWKISEESNGN